MAFPKRKKQADQFRAKVADDACPVCGASGDEPCKTKSGKDTADHKARPPA